jgi:hypothetical protein
MGCVRVDRKGCALWAVPLRARTRPNIDVMPTIPSMDACNRSDEREEWLGGWGGVEVSG